MFLCVQYKLERFNMFLQVAVNTQKLQTRYRNIADIGIFKYYRISFDLSDDFPHTSLQLLVSIQIFKYDALAPGANVTYIEYTKNFQTEYWRKIPSKLTQISPCLIH